MELTLTNTDIKNLDRFKKALYNDKNLLIREFAIKYGTDREMQFQATMLYLNYAVIIIMLTINGHSTGLILL